ncbi:MAG: hypothetical protein Q4C61_03395 [Lachnospiraceae bacterium]|nr:hypothetical protein [Lachnospiraceae bacterium]
MYTKEPVRIASDKIRIYNVEMPETRTAGMDNFTTFTIEPMQTRSFATGMSIC